MRIMRKILFLIFISVFICFSQIIDTENFEETGSPSSFSSWNDVGADFDFTADPIVGDKSMMLKKSATLAQRCYFSSSLDSLYIFYICRFDSGFDATGSRPLTRFYGMEAAMYTNASEQLALYAGSVSVPFAGVTWTADTQYYIWIFIKKGTGADAICRLWRSTKPTKPASVTAEVTDGNSTSQASRVYFHSAAAQFAHTVDEIIISETEIGDYEAPILYVDPSGSNGNSGLQPDEALASFDSIDATTREVKLSGSIAIRENTALNDGLTAPRDTFTVTTYDSSTKSLSTGTRARISHIDPNSKIGITVSNCVYFTGWTWDYSTCARDSVETARANASQGNLLRLK